MIMVAGGLPEEDTIEIKEIKRKIGSTRLRDVYLKNDRRIFRPSCSVCFSKNIEIDLNVQFCRACGAEALFFDEVRFEVVCTVCGWVNAGTSCDTVYMLGFLLRMPNWLYCSDKSE